MKNFLAVFNSNQVNRYGSEFTVSCLASCLDQSWEYGIPLYLSHDYHRCMGWTHGRSLYIEPGLVRLVGRCLIPDNENERVFIDSVASKRFKKHIKETVAPHMNEFEKLLSPHLTGNEDAFCADSASICSEGLAKKAFPEIFSQKDDDGLIPIRLLNQKYPGVFEKNGLLLFAHPFFRRSLSRHNTLNVPFFKTLLSIEDEKGLNIRIALDEDMIGLATTFRPSIELEYWWGPRFTSDLESIPTGVTVHNASEEMKFYHGISRTEFGWYIQDSKRTFECEEIRDLPSIGIGNDRFGCRFVHSMLDTTTLAPTHLDGAIRMYTEATMIQRLDKTIDHVERKSEYTKLWRIDGVISIPFWKELITHYYRDNHLVGEYFKGVEVTDHVEPQLSDSKNNFPLEEYIPCNLNKDEGIRIAVSYSPQIKGSSSERFIKSHSQIRRNAQIIPYVEADTFELIKILHHMHESIEMPEYLTEIAFEDAVTNFPTVHHTGLNAVKLAIKTQDAVKQLCSTWNHKGIDRILSYTLEIQYEDRDVVLSFAGHIQDLAMWYQSPYSTLPSNVQQLGEWCENAAKILAIIYPNSMDKPKLQNIMQDTGILEFKRCFLNPDEYCFKPSEKQLLMDYLIPEDNVSLCAKIQSGELSAAIANIIKSSQCSNCGAEYESCPCSKYTNPSVSQKVIESSVLGPFWTNRSSLLRTNLGKCSN